MNRSFRTLTLSVLAAALCASEFAAGLCAATINVSTVSGLQNAINNANPGDMIVAANGNLAALIDGTGGMRCVGSYPTAEAALRAMPKEPPDIALIDINLPGMSGIECVAQLKARMPELMVVMLTTYEEGELIFDSLRAGASGYLLKSMPPEELVEAFEQAHAGGAPMSMRIARKVVEHFHRRAGGSNGVGKLTPREHEILSLLAKGSMYKEIGDRLGISIPTVRSHLRHIYEKLHVQTRTEAAAKFFSGI